MARTTRLGLCQPPSRLRLVQPQRRPEPLRWGGKKRAPLEIAIIRVRYADWAPLSVGTFARSPVWRASARCTRASPPPCRLLLAVRPRREPPGPTFRASRDLVPARGETPRGHPCWSATLTQLAQALRAVAMSLVRSCGPDSSSSGHARGAAGRVFATRRACGPRACASRFARPGPSRERGCRCTVAAQDVAERCSPRVGLDCGRTPRPSRTTARRPLTDASGVRCRRGAAPGQKGRSLMLLRPSSPPSIRRWRKAISLGRRPHPGAGPRPVGGTRGSSTPRPPDPPGLSTRPRTQSALARDAGPAAHPASFVRCSNASGCACTARGRGSVRVVALVEA